MFVCVREREIERESRRGWWVVGVGVLKALLCGEDVTLMRFGGRSRGWLFRVGLGEC